MTLKSPISSEEKLNSILDDVVSADDLDVVMRDGLGLRYAFMGPMETIHLNAMGTKVYCETYGDTIYNVSKDMGPIPEAWRMNTEEDKAKVCTMYFCKNNLLRLYTL